MAPFDPREREPLFGPRDDPSRTNERIISATRWILLLALLVALVTSLAHAPPTNLLASVTRSASQKCTYKSTQFISFTINTLGGRADHGECHGRPVDPDYEGAAVCYLGNPNNLTEDLYHRLAIIEEALQVLREDHESDDPEIDVSPDVLKIFQVPEFFLRGPYGAYSKEMLLGEDEPILLEISDRITELVTGAEWEDYLFVFGTVIVASQENDSDWLYWNLAPIFAGGATVQRYVATKKYISTADFLDRNTQLPNPAETHYAEYDPATDELEKLIESRVSTLLDTNVWELDGIRFGVEICLDHRLGSLWSTLQAQHNPVHERHLVDVLLVVSAGMALERGPNPLRKGGVAYLTDGEASSAACLRSPMDGPFDPDDICRQDPGHIKHIPVAQESSEYILMSGCYDFLNHTHMLDGYYSLYQTQGCAYTLKLYGIDVLDEYSYYPPSLEIYPTIQLPH